jgi:hypothetical protein
MKQIRKHWTDVNVKRSLCHLSSLFRCAIVKTTWRERERDRERNDSKLWKKRERKRHGWNDLVAFFLSFYIDRYRVSLCMQTHTLARLTWLAHSNSDRRNLILSILFFFSSFSLLSFLSIQYNVFENLSYWHFSSN